MIHIAPSDFMTSIDQQHTSPGSCAISSTLTSTIK